MVLIVILHLPTVCWMPMFPVLLAKHAVPQAILASLTVFVAVSAQQVVLGPLVRSMLAHVLTQPSQALITISCAVHVSILVMWLRSSIDSTTCTLQLFFTLTLSTTIPAETGHAVGRLQMAICPVQTLPRSRLMLQLLRISKPCSHLMRP